MERERMDVVCCRVPPSVKAALRRRMEEEGKKKISEVIREIIDRDVAAAERQVGPGERDDA